MTKTEVKELMGQLKIVFDIVRLVDVTVTDGAQDVLACRGDG